MDWEQWKPTYDWIVQKLSLDSNADRRATEVLTVLLQDIEPAPLLDRLAQVISDKKIAVCGAGPSLERHVSEIINQEDMEGVRFIVADGAVSLFREHEWPCHILVTDLDGDIADIKDSAEAGTLVIVHAHGDNIPQVRQVVPDLGRVLGSTQVEPTERAFLWGGFTDGDRACHIAVENNPREILLAGMDLGTIVGKWSKPNHGRHFPASERKRTKLEIAGFLLDKLFSESAVSYRFME